MADDPKQDVKTEAVSPTGQVVGLSALLAAAPPWTMNVLLALMGIAGALETVAITADGFLPVAVVKVAHVTLAVGAVLGIASPGARK